MVCWAVFAILPSFFARRIAFSTRLLSAAVSLVSGRITRCSQPTAVLAGGFVLNGNKLLYLLFIACLPLQSGKPVVGLVRSGRRCKQPDTDDIFQNLFQRLPVLLIQPEQHKGRCQGKNCAVKLSDTL